MSTPHTPGPWAVEPADFGANITAPMPQGGRIVVAKVRATMFAMDDAELTAANARLIAAAPELLAALNSSLDSIYSMRCFFQTLAKSVMDASEQKRFSGIGEKLQSEEDAARAAIAKATEGGK